MATVKTERLLRRTLLRNILTSPRGARHFHKTAIWAAHVRAFKLADIGEGITECEVIKWCVLNTFTLKNLNDVS